MYEYKFVWRKKYIVEKIIWGKVSTKVFFK